MKNPDHDGNSQRRPRLRTRLEPSILLRWSHPLKVALARLRTLDTIRTIEGNA